MKRKYSLSSSLIVLGFLFLGIITTFGFAYKQQPQQKFTGTFTANEAQIIVNAITDPDNFSVNQRKEIANNFAKGLVPIADTTKKK